MRRIASACFALLVACGGRGRSGDGGTASGAVGSPCERNADCAEGLCLPITDTSSVCTETCQTTDDCVAGWTCGPVPGVSDDLCNCDPSAEGCDGIDNDCDAVVDDGIGDAVGCPVGNECVDAACRCAPQNTCGGGCVDTSTDPAHCGGCGVTCTSSALCLGGACVVPAGITAGTGHACAWFEGGPAYCWGNNLSEQIVLGAPSSALLPTRLEVGDVRTVVAGGACTCVVGVDGNVVCQGLSERLGSGPPDPSVHRATPITSGDAVGVVSGAVHTCAWLRDGRVFCWGMNDNGQLGTGPIGMDLYTPTLVEGLDPVVNMAAGLATTCAVVQSGELYCWGEIPGTMMNSVTPVPIDLPAVEHLAVYTQVVAVTSDGQLWGWGANALGQAGADPVSPVLLDPAPIATPSSAIGVTAGSFHSCAVSAGGDAYCWGRNSYGELGTGSTVASYMPVLVVGGHSFRAVDAGGAYNCGIAEDAVYCWGSRGSGQLGDGMSAPDALSPIPVQLF